MHEPATVLELLRGDGHRITAQRRCIVEALAVGDAHPTVEALHGAAAAVMPALSLATVYQAVHELEALGEIRLVDVGLGRLLVDTNAAHDHQHVVCQGCGLVRDVDLAPVAALLGPAELHGFEVRSADVVVRGLCPSCRTTPVPDHTGL